MPPKGRSGGIVIRPPKPITTAILVLRGKNGISRTIRFTNPNPRGPSFKPPKISTAAEDALLRQIVRDKGKEKDDEKVPEN